MKTMEDYELRCTAKQTRRAYALGATIKTHYVTFPTRKAIADGVYREVSREEYYKSQYALPFIHKLESEDNVDIVAEKVTTQQMIGWLREKGFLFKFEEEPNGINIVEIRKKLNNSSYRVICVVKTDKSAELAAIDAALDCLEKEKE